MTGLVAAGLDETRIVPRRRFAKTTERNLLGYRRYWPILFAGIVEPFLYLLSIGVGVGELVDDVPHATGPIDYRTFVAGGMLAAAAMNGAIMETTYTFFIRFKYGKVYDAVLATPMEPRDVALGEVVAALVKGAFYAACFLVAMVALGLSTSWWVLALLPVTVLVGAAFAAVGLAGSTFMRSWVDFDLIQLFVMPQFLFAGTFFPLSEYPDGVRTVVEWTPLWQGVELCRDLQLGHVHAGLVPNVVYLAALVVVGVVVAGRRLDAQLRP